MHRLLPLFVNLILSSFVPIADAHHGFSAHFDPDEVIRIQGTVKRFDFINPHGYLYIDSVNDAGEPVVFVCDLQSRNQLVRNGADETLFTVGESIVVMAFAARRDPLRCEFGVGYFSDGSSFTMRSIDKARTKFAENQLAPLAPGAQRSIVGVWIRPGMFGDLSGVGAVSGEDSITAAGQAAHDAYDPVADNPVIRCDGVSPVRNWRPPGLATSIRQEENQIIIYHESMDTTRIVHMNMTEHPADIPSSIMGHSIGRFEDGYLIIETVAFSNGVLTGSIQHTDQLILQERLSINNDNGRLLIEWTATDPAFYSIPIKGSQQLQSTSQDIIRYDCIPGEPTDYQ